VAAAVGPDAPDRYAQLGADLGKGHWGVGDEHGQQSLAGGGQAGEPLAQGGIALCREQLMVAGRGLIVWHVWQLPPVGGQAARAAQDPAAFPPGGDGQPAR
jgi:hypothetical protein